MDLAVRDVAKLLGVSEKTVYRWLAAGTVPHRRLGTQYRFDRNELAAWAVSSGQSFAATTQEAEAGGPLPSLPQALAAGGILSGIEAENPAEAIRAVLELMTLPPEVDRTYLFHALTARESLGSTGVGDGFAVPHTRFPLAALPAPRLTLAFAARPIPWNAIDGLPVRVIFIPLNRTMRGHLYLLSRLAFVLRDPVWRQLLAQAPPAPAILDGLRAAEARLGRTRSG